MKTFFKITLVLLGLGILCFLGYKVFTKIQHKNKVATTLQTIPEFSFKTLNGEGFTKEQLDKTKAVIFIYFNSGCDYCEHEAESIKESIHKFQNSQIIFVSNQSAKEIEEFSKTYQLHSYDNIYFLSDPRDHFTHNFDATSIPYLLIYDKNHRLIKKHKGQLKADHIAKILQEK